MVDIITKRAMVGRCREEEDVGAEVVLTALHVIVRDGITETRHARLDGNAVARLEMCHIGTDFDYSAGALMAQDHRLAHHEISDATMLPVMNIRAADADFVNLDARLP